MHGCRHTLLQLKCMVAARVCNDASSEAQAENVTRLSSLLARRNA